MSKELSGRVALVTGGGRGIGRACALALADAGATVVVAGRGADDLDQTVRLVERAGGAASAVTADVTVPAQVAGLVGAVVARHGGLHVAVNNAGTLAAGPVADLDVAEWERQLAVNLTGVFLCLKYEITHMRDNGGGAIVNVASNIGAHMRRAGMGGYAASKAGVSALTRTAALENIGHGVRVNAVSPGPADTPMSMRPGETTADRDERLRSAVPIGRVGALAEIAAAVLWLAGPDCGYLVGHDLVVDGGATA